MVCVWGSEPRTPPPESVTLTTRPPGLRWQVKWSDRCIIQYGKGFMCFIFLYFFFVCKSRYFCTTYTGELFKEYTSYLTPDKSICQNRCSSILNNYRLYKLFKNMYNKNMYNQKSSRHRKKLKHSYISHITITY